MSPRDLALDHPEVQALRLAFDALRRTAITAADKAVQAERKSVPAYRPARLSQRSLDRLHTIWLSAYDREIGLRMGQLVRVDAKIARICSGWMAHTVEELATPPEPWGPGITLVTNQDASAVPR